LKYFTNPPGRPTFPSTCLSPDQPGFGQITSGETRRRRTRRAPISAQTTMSNNWIISHSTPPEPQIPSQSHAHNGVVHRHRKEDGMVVQISRRASDDHEVSDSSYSSIMQEGKGLKSSTSSKMRYTPYQPPYPRARFFPSIAYGPHHYVDSRAERDTVESSTSTEGTSHKLPAFRHRSSRASISLPSISDLVGLAETNCRDTATTVLERLKSDQGYIPRRQSYPDDKWVNTFSVLLALNSDTWKQGYRAR
jgi:hypothetical protein